MQLWSLVFFFLTIAVVWLQGLFLVSMYFVSVWKCLTYRHDKPMYLDHIIAIVCQRLLEHPFVNFCARAWSPAGKLALASFALALLPAMFY